jgi:hypothetical protein
MPKRPPTKVEIRFEKEDGTPLEVKELASIFEKIESLSLGKEPPLNSFPSKITGLSEEIIYWAPKGFKDPVCEDFKDTATLKKLYDKAFLNYLHITGCVGGIVDYDIYKKVKSEKIKNEKLMKRLKKKALEDEAIPFVSISSMPLDYYYFSAIYHYCYFASKPFKMEDGSYLTVGVIGP